VERGLPTIATELTPDHLEAFIVSLYERGKRLTTILARHHALSRFFGWLVAENELDTSPMASIRAPTWTMAAAAAISCAWWALPLMQSPEVESLLRGSAHTAPPAHHRQPG
jgi:site-specific recombinase XerC